MNPYLRHSQLLMPSIYLIMQINLLFLVPESEWHLTMKSKNFTKILSGLIISQIYSQFGFTFIRLELSYAIT